MLFSNKALYPVDCVDIQMNIQLLLFLTHTLCSSCNNDYVFWQALFGMTKTRKAAWQEAWKEAGTRYWGGSSAGVCESIVKVSLSPSPSLVGAR